MKMDLNRFELWDTLLSNVNDRVDVYGSNDNIAKRYAYLTFKYGIITKKSYNMILSKISKGNLIETQDLMQSEDLII